MKALVIGGSGMLGRALIDALEKDSIDTTATYLSNPFPGGIPLDVRDPTAIDKCFDDEQPELVFIAITPPGGTDYCESHPEQARAVNVEATRSIAQRASRDGTRVIYYSSDYVFDGIGGPYTEEHPTNPINVYGRTKVEAEEVLAQLCPNALVIRTTAVFAWDRKSPNFAMQVWDRLTQGNTMRVPDDQVGNPTLASYLAEVSIRLVQQREYGTFNVVGSDRMPRSEFGITIAKAIGLDSEQILPAHTTEIGQVADRPLDAGLLTDKLERAIGTPPPTLRDSLRTFRRQWRSDTHVPRSEPAPFPEATILKKEILDKVSEYYKLVHEPKSFVPFESRVQYSGRVFGEDEMRNLVDSSLDFWLTLGPYGDLFEHRMRQLMKSRDFVLVNSGSSANLTAIMTLMSKQLERPLVPGDEVITPAVTFPTTLAPIVHSGLVPVFVDARVGTYNIDPDLIEDAISDRTRALFIPHTLGNPCDMEKITAIAERHDLYLVEDACDALGGKFDGQLVGTFGQLATLSFYPAHHITMGEGGGVIVNDRRMGRIARSVRDWGRDCWCAPGESNTCGTRFGWELGDLSRGYDHKYVYSNIGYNFKPTDMQAAIGVAQLDRLEGFNRARNRNFKRLYEGLSEFEDRIILPVIDPRAEPSWFGFPITVRDSAARNGLVHALERAQIETRTVFAGDITRQPGYQNINSRVHGELSETSIIMRDTIFFGLYPGLGDEQIDFTLSQISDYFQTA